MTKAEELKILEAIEGLIAESGPDSYISMTFSGICDICRNNIENDFGDSPGVDLNLERERFYAESRMHDETKRMLADAQKELKIALDENKRLRKLADEWEQNAHEAGDLYCELEKEMVLKDAEIIHLKAEIYDLRKELGK